MLAFETLILTSLLTAASIWVQIEVAR